MSRRWGQTLFSDAQQRDNRQWAQTETHGVPSEYEKKLYFEGDRAVEQAAQWLWSLFLWRYLKPPGCSPVQPVAGEPALAGVV